MSRVTTIARPDTRIPSEPIRTSEIEFRAESDLIRFGAMVECLRVATEGGVATDLALLGKATALESRFSNSTHQLIDCGANFVKTVPVQTRTADIDEPDCVLTATRATLSSSPMRLPESNPTATVAASASAF